jgi:hypothetical protein
MRHAKLSKGSHGLVNKLLAMDDERTRPALGRNARAHLLPPLEKMPIRFSAPGMHAMPFCVEPACN